VSPVAKRAPQSQRLSACTFRCSSKAIQGKTIQPVLQSNDNSLCGQVTIAMDRFIFIRPLVRAQSVHIFENSNLFTMVVI
jgi:hypothetical protein